MAARKNKPQPIQKTLDFLTDPTSTEEKPVKPKKKPSLSKKEAPKVAPKVKIKEEKQKEVGLGIPDVTPPQEPNITKLNNVRTKISELRGRVLDLVKPKKESKPDQS